MTSCFSFHIFESDFWNSSFSFLPLKERDIDCQNWTKACKKMFKCDPSFTKRLGVNEKKNYVYDKKFDTLKKKHWGRIFSQFENELVPSWERGIWEKHRELVPRWERAFPAHSQPDLKYGLSKLYRDSTEVLYYNKTYSQTWVQRPPSGSQN